MKKHALLLIIPLYVLLSSGVTLNYHYCMGHLTDVALWEKTVCPACGMEHNELGKCCSTATKMIKLSVDQDVAHFQIIKCNPTITTLLFDLIEWHSLLIPRQKNIAYIPHKSPPECISTPLFIRNCTFLI